MISLPGVAESASVTLAWDPSPDADVAGYLVYSGVVSGFYGLPLDVGPQTTATVSNLEEGVTHFFVVTAYNSWGLESDPSNEISYTPPVVTGPTPVPAPTITTFGLSTLPETIFVATIEGPANRIYRIEVSEDLRTWTPLQTLTNLTGTVQVLDENPSAHQQRFYRALMNLPKVGDGYSDGNATSTSPL